LTSKANQIDWRRSSVMDLSSQGYSEREIAAKLQVTRATVHLDLQFITKRAQESLQSHIHKVIPLEYHRSMTGMKSNLKKVIQIADDTGDPKLKLQAISFANECYKNIMDLCTNAGIISDALEYVTKQKERISTIEQLDEKIKQMEPENAAGGIF
jgi:IS30 family transposase